MTKIVFSDVDGTLLNSDHKITPLTENAIKELQKKDIPFVIISARSPSGIYPIQQEYGLTCPVISYSGALILDQNRNVLYHKGISKEKAGDILTFIEKEKFDLTWCIYSMDEWFVKDRQDPRIVREERIVKATASEGSIDDVTADEVNKILCICNPEKTLEIEAALKKQFPEYSIVKSSDILLEIMESGITKATAIETLCSLWNIPLSETVAFGDNYNDVEMLETAAHGFLMGNAPNELKKRIPDHTPDNNHDGICYALRSLKLI